MQQGNSFLRGGRHDPVLSWRARLPSSRGCRHWNLGDPPKETGSPRLPPPLAVGASGPTSRGSAFASRVGPPKATGFFRCRRSALPVVRRRGSTEARPPAGSARGIRSRRIGTIKSRCTAEKKRPAGCNPGLRRHVNFGLRFCPGRTSIIDEKSGARPLEFMLQHVGGGAVQAASKAAH